MHRFISCALRMVCARMGIAYQGCARLRTREARGCAQGKREVARGKKRSGIVIVGDRQPPPLPQRTRLMLQVWSNPMQRIATSQQHPLSTPRRLPILDSPMALRLPPVPSDPLSLCPMFPLSPHALQPHTLPH
eukprot:312141-Chlamydomonas_euryale.AAC.1